MSFKKKIFYNIYLYPRYFIYSQAITIRFIFEKWKTTSNYLEIDCSA
jgi:hypothetical protein